MASRRFAVQLNRRGSLIVPHPGSTAYPFGGTLAFYRGGGRAPTSLLNPTGHRQAPWGFVFFPTGGISYAFWVQVSDRVYASTSHQQVQSLWQSEAPQRDSIYAIQPPVDTVPSLSTPSDAVGLVYALVNRVLGTTVAGKTPVTDYYNVFKVFSAMDQSFVGQDFDRVRVRSKIRNGNLSPWITLDSSVTHYFDVGFRIASEVNFSYVGIPNGAPDPWVQARRDHAFVRDNPSVYQWYRPDGNVGLPPLVWYESYISFTADTTQASDAVDVFQQWNAVGMDGVVEIEVSFDYDDVLIPTFPVSGFLDAAWYDDLDEEAQAVEPARQSTLERAVQNAWGIIRSFGAEYRAIADAVGWEIQVNPDALGEPFSFLRWYLDTLDARMELYADWVDSQDTADEQSLEAISAAMRHSIDVFEGVAVVATAALISVKLGLLSAAGLVGKQLLKEGAKGVDTSGYDEAWIQELLEELADLPMQDADEIRAAIEAGLADWKAERQAAQDVLEEWTQTMLGQRAQPWLDRRRRRLQESEIWTR